MEKSSDLKNKALKKFDLKSNENENQLKFFKEERGIHSVQPSA